MFINYDSYKFPGLFDKTIHVFTGDDGTVEDIIHVKGDVTPIPMGVLEVSPRKIALENIKVGQESTHTITIKNTGDAPMMVDRLDSRKFEKSYWKGQALITPGASLDFEIVVTPEEAGTFTDFLMVYSDARNDFGKGYKAVLSGVAE